VRTLSAALKAWKAEEGQTVPVVVLYDIEVTDSTTLRLVQGNPTGAGSLTYDGNVYLAAAIELRDVEESVEGDVRDRELAVSNIDGIAGGYIEQNDLEGRRVTITTVLLSTLSPADAVVETYTIQDQQYDREAAIVTLGHSALFKRRVPWRRFERPRCQWDYEKRFLHEHGCGYPSDWFGPDRRQNLKAGSTTDDEEARLHGWYSLNVSHADVFAADSDVVPDQLYIESTSGEMEWSGATRGGPFLYKKLSGDFDVWTQIDLFDTRPGSLSGLLCQEDAAGLDSWVMFGLGETTSFELVARLQAALNGVQQPDSDSVVTNDKYLRLTRVGNTWTFYHAATVDVSAPTTGWTQLAQKTFALDGSVRLGLAMSATPAEAPSRVAAGFQSIRFNSGGLPACLRTLDDCRLHGNTARFFGFPGIPRR
jgi:phage-related protein